MKIKTLFIVQIDNKNKWEYNEYIVKNDKITKGSKEKSKSKTQKMRKKAARAAEWRKQWEKKRKRVSQL